MMDGSIVRLCFGGALIEQHGGRTRALEKLWVGTGRCHVTRSEIVIGIVYAHTCNIELLPLRIAETSRKLRGETFV